MGTVTAAPRKKHSTRPGFRYQPQLELLEDRTVPSSIRVAAIGGISDDGNRAADSIFASQLLPGSVDRNLSTSAFNALSPAQLRSNYDVLLVTLNADTGLHLDWNTRLLPFMKLGGDIIWEDENNINQLASIVTPGRVSFTGISYAGESPFESLNVTSVPGLTDGYTGNAVSHNIEFDGWNAALQPFLSINNKTVGLYGQFGAGRIVFAPANDFYGDPNGDSDQYYFLMNELHWVAARNQVSIGSDVSTIQAGQALTVNLTYNSLGDLDANNGWKINWGDRDGSGQDDIQTVEGNATTVSHVYADSDFAHLPNAFVVKATAMTTIGPVDSSNQLLVNVLVPAIDTADGAGSIALDGDKPVSRTFATPDGTATATVNYAGDSDGSGRTLVVFLAHYRATASYDLHVSGANSGDSVTVLFSVPPSAVAPVLRYVVPGSVPAQYRDVPGSMIESVKDAAGHILYFRVTFTATTPLSFKELSETVFTISDIPTLTVATTIALDLQSMPNHPPTTNEDLLGSLLASQSTNNGTLTGVVSPTQITSISAQAAGADSEADTLLRRGEAQQVQQIFDGLWREVSQMLGVKFQLFTEAFFRSANAPKFSEPAAPKAAESSFLAVPENQLVPCEHVEFEPEFGPSPFWDLPSSEQEDVPWISMNESPRDSCLALAVVPLLSWGEGFRNVEPERERRERRFV